MKQPSLFSIIMPTYNRGYIIWKTIQSIQQQVYPYWEIFIVDDGSNDNTKQVVAEFQKDPRIHYIYKPHSHVSDARNEGLKHVKGDFITYVDSDDILYDIYLSTALEYFTKYPEKMFAIPNYNKRIELYDENYKLVDFTEVSSAQKQEITLQDFYHWKVKTCGTGIFHRKEALEKGIVWDNRIKSFQEWDYIMQLGNHYPNGFMHIPYVLFEYLQKYGGDGVCSNMTYGDWVKDYKVMYQKHKDDSLLQGQQWYPDRIERYTKLQEQVDRGEVLPAMYKYFPNAKK